MTIINEPEKCFVIGEDEEGNLYRLPIISIAREMYMREITVRVHLPFKPDHKIWEELRNGNN